jgi:hypothetical protein
MHASFPQRRHRLPLVQPFALALPLLLAALSTTTACAHTSDPIAPDTFASATGPDADHSYGYLGTSLTSAPVAITPAVIRVGGPVTFVVNTFGSSSCVTPNGMELQRGATTVLFTPWDRVASAGTACTKDLAARPHEARLTFDRKGPVTVTVRGLAHDTDGTLQLRNISLTIDVQ